VFYGVYFTLMMLYVLFFTYLLQLYVMSAINVNTTAFAEGVGYTPLVAPLFLSFAVGISVPGRFVCGWITDHIAPPILMASAGLAMAGSALVLVLLVINLGMTGPVPIWLFAALQGLGIVPQSFFGIPSSASFLARSAPADEGLTAVSMCRIFPSGPM
jgi:hypothetical protein